MTPYRRRPPRVEIARSTVALFPGLEPPPPPPPTDAELRSWSYRNLLQWAADRDGRLSNRDRLRRIARIKNFHPGWIKRVFDRHVERVLTEARRWQERQLSE